MSSGAACRDAWLRPWAGDAVADPALRKHGGSLSFFPAVKSANSNTRGCTDVRRGRQLLPWTSRERGRPSAWQSRTPEALMVWGVGWGWAAAFHCQVDAFPLPAASAKTGTSAYLRDVCQLRPDQKAPTSCLGLWPRETRTKGRPVLSAATVVYNLMRTWDLRSWQKAWPAGEGSRPGPGTAEGGGRRCPEDFSPGSAGRPRLRNPMTHSSRCGGHQYGSPGLGTDGLLWPFSSANQIPA